MFAHSHDPVVHSYKREGEISLHATMAYNHHDILLSEKSKVKKSINSMLPFIQDRDKNTHTNIQRYAHTCTCFYF